MSISELVLELYDDLGTWTRVAECLGWSASLWWQIVKQGRQPTRQQSNAVLRHYDKPEIPEPPTEIVARSGVGRVKVLSDNPDVALLVDSRGQEIVRVTVTGAGIPAPESSVETSVRFTQGKIPGEGRNRVSKGILSCSTLEPLDPTKIGRGKSGNPDAIRDAAQRAAAELL